LKVAIVPGRAQFKVL